MKRDIDPAVLLNSLLSDWHAWGSPRNVNGKDKLAKPPEVINRAGWDSADDEADRRDHLIKMETIDFVVSGDRKGLGAMTEPYKSAIYALARNCWAGSSVWSSPRLPRDSLERNRITNEARVMLTARLRAAGVMPLAAVRTNPRFNPPGFEGIKNMAKNA